MMKKTLIAGLLLFQAWGAQAECLSDLAQIPESWKLESLKTNWRESEASDSKPLLIRLSPRGNQILAAISKSGEGLWADGIAEICPTQGGMYNLKMSRIKTTSAAPAVLAKKLSAGDAVFAVQFSSNHRAMKLTIPGPMGLSWTGRFHAL